MWRLVLAALQAEGPIAIKFAQWASTRPDILPRSVCDHLSPLQASVRPHSFQQTKRILTETFGPTWEKSLQLEAEPLGSGCMAQVHRGCLHGPLEGQRPNKDAAPEQPRNVAVKVLHPGAQDKVDLDLEVMWMIVSLVEALWPPSRFLSMSEAVMHFESFVRPQADLRIEADNLDMFNNNFPYRRTGKGLRVIFPEVLRPYVTKDLLVESLEDGVPLQAVLGKDARASRDCKAAPPPTPVEELREEVGGLCMDAFLKMLFADNFIHADLHPGNIHFHRRRVGGDTGPVQSELVIFDAGLAVQMSPKDRRNFVDVFYALTTNDGKRAAQLMVERTPGDRSLVRDEDEFVASVGQLVNEVCGMGFALGKVRLGECFGRMLTLACDHRVKLETSFVTVATSIIVLEGVGRQLNPIADLAAAARPLLAEAVANVWRSS